MLKHLFRESHRVVKRSMPHSEYRPRASVAQRFMPEDMTLPSNVQFSRTFISKQLSEALKLTRHVPQTRLSPMAMYMSSKGSTSWEASVKLQPNTTQDDFAPAGWKIVETANENTIVDDGKKKAGGGLLSFFGRRTAIAQSDAISRSNSPPVNSLVISSLKDSPRASVDNMRSTTMVDSGQGSGRTAPASPIASSSSMLTQKNDSNPTASSVTLDSIVPEPTPPPSAVSRFLGRFSSRANKPRDSLALSQDDLEFLSDVPTFNESESNPDSESDALSMMIKSPPLTTTLPPPLAPPPRLSQPTRTLSQATKVEKSFMDDDPFSIFNSSDFASKFAHPPMKSLTAAPTSPVGVPLSNLALSSTVSPLVHSRNPEGTSNTQGRSSFDNLPAPVNGILPIKRVVVAMTPPNNPSTPPPVPKPNVLSERSSSYNHWPGRDSVTSGLTDVISPLPPPPGSRSHTPSHTTLSPSIQVAVKFDDDDEFSEFLSSPAPSAPPVPPSFTHNALTMNLANLSSLVGQPPTTTNNSFDGFDDFLGPFSADPQPPQPPAKPKPQHFVHAPNSAPPNNQRTSNTQSLPQQQHSRTVSKADHSRTLSLLENVAARGPWLQPASPLPEALPPPVSSNLKPSGNDLFTYGSTMQAQQAQAAASLSIPFQAPTLKVGSQNGSRQPAPAHLLPPPMSSQPSLSKPPMLHPSSMNAAVTPTEVKSGGLSAQDLSFFEGL